MTDDRIELTRRKILAATGAVGVAGATAGIGTSAFFSDEEEFDDNTLTAGALDIKVDWEEHYSDWSDDEAQAAPGVRMVDSADDVGDDEIGLPDAENPMIAVPTDQLDAFMDATAIEAYPDTDNGGDGDGIQDDLAAYSACDDFADTDKDLDPSGGNGSGSRTLNSDTVDANGDPKPLVSLDDVKPGDFGELTLSFHLCDNPGYVWLQGGLDSAAENDWTEPEAEDVNETGNATDSVSALDDPAASNIEILDEVQTLLWYDEDGDNVYEPGGSGGDEVDVMLVLDDSGSMGNRNKLSNAKSAAKNLVNALNLGSNAGQVGLVRFDDDVSMPQGLTTDASKVTGKIDQLDAGGGTNIEEAVDYAHEELVPSNDVSANNPTGNARSSAEKIMVVLSDGRPNENGDGVDEGDAVFGNADPADNAQAAKDAGVEMFTVGFGDISGDVEDLLREMASDPKNGHFFTAKVDEIEEVFAQISQAVSGEECFWRGSLRDLLDELSSGLGIPLDGNRDTAYDEIKDPADADARDCFVDSTNNFLGFAWYLPVDHANEIQTDSVSFDLGFYTEQCRHNDGSGQAPEGTQTPTA